MTSKCISKFSESFPPSLVNYGDQVHLQTHSITASEWITKLAQSQPPCSSPNLLNHGNYDLPVHLLSHSIMASKFGRLSPPSAYPNLPYHGFQVHKIIAFKCNSKLIRLRPPSASPSSFDFGLQVHLHTWSMTAGKCDSKFSSVSSLAAPWIALKHRLQPGEIYHG